MIAFVDGVLVDKQPARVLVDVHGLGYELLIPLSSFDRLPATGATCRLLTHFHVREDAQVLYGFLTEAERAMFRLLMDVTGIGPKLALSALSGMTVRELKRAIVEGDAKRLSGISGIGRKTAERISMELRDKIPSSAALEALSSADDMTPADSRSRDAMAALIALGYKTEDARRLVVDANKALPDTADLQALLKKALNR